MKGQLRKSSVIFSWIKLCSICGQLVDYLENDICVTKVSIDKWTTVRSKQYKFHNHWFTPSSSFMTHGKIVKFTTLEHISLVWGIWSKFQDSRIAIPWWTRELHFDKNSWKIVPKSCCKLVSGSRE